MGLFQFVSDNLILIYVCLIIIFITLLTTFSIYRFTEQEAKIDYTLNIIRTIRDELHSVKQRLRECCTASFTREDPSSCISIHGDLGNTLIHVSDDDEDCDGDESIIESEYDTEDNETESESESDNDSDNVCIENVEQRDFLMSNINLLNINNIDEDLDAPVDDGMATDLNQHGMAPLDSEEQATTKLVSIVNADDKCDEGDDDNKDDVDDNEDEVDAKHINIVDLSESEMDKTNKATYKKMSVGQLRQVIGSRMPELDVSKLKKTEILNMIFTPSKI